MNKANNNQVWWKVELENMPQFEMAMKRVYAWFENQISSNVWRHGPETTRCPRSPIQEKPDDRGFEKEVVHIK